MVRTNTNKLKVALGVVLALAAWLLYINTLSGEFIKDDIYQVLRNEWIRDFRNTPEMIFSSVWSFMEDGGEATFYRPVMHLSYMISYALSELRPWGFHLVNILLHSLNVIMVYLLSLRLLRDTIEGGADTSNDSRPGKRTVYGAFGAALIFAAHPINTEAVAWVAAVPELSFTLFFLISFYFFIREKVLLSTAFFFLSVFSKETAVVLPILFALYTITIGPREGRLLKGGALGWVKGFAPYLLVICIYLIMRVVALGALAPVSRGSEGGLPLYLSALNSIPLLLKYIEKLFLPVNLVYFHHIRFDIITGFGPGAAAYLLTTLVSTGLLFILYKKEKRIFFFAAWILVALIPALGLAFLRGSPDFSERYLYFPAAGFGLILVSIALKFIGYCSGKTGVNAAERRRKRGTLAVTIAFTLLILVYSAGTVKRNAVWSSSIGLWADVVEKAPENMTARLWYYNELIKSERLDAAIDALNGAIEISPPGDDALDGLHNNLGIAYAKKGMIRAAALEFQKALSIAPENKEAATNLEQAAVILRAERQNK